MRIKEALSAGPNRAGCPDSTAKGFSLVESLLASVILGISVAGISSLLISGVKENELSVKYAVAADLAHSLLNEIISKPFYDPDNPSLLNPGPDGGEKRWNLDNVDDYEGLFEPAGLMYGPAGWWIIAPSLANFSRSATAAYVYLPGQDVEADPTFILVTVKVMDGSQSLVELKRLVSTTSQEVY
jgi:prepilin-type N-terminal cleavage/methylation domain-containing protein